jgi:FixJ family two-component response regulator
VRQATGLLEFCRKERGALVESIGDVIGVIEDDDGMRKALRRVLFVAGYQVEVFGSVEEWLAVQHRHDWACLILDVRLPGLSGLDLQKQLIHAGRQIPIIFLTANAEECAREQALGRGALDYLLKPLDPAILLENVRRALSARATPETAPVAP